MANVFDLDTIVSPVEKKPEPKKRSKNRETLTPAQRTSGQVKLHELVDIAFNTLEEAMIFGDYSTATKAAQITLDRAGYGPKSTVDINQTSLDLSALSKEELAQRAQKLADHLRLVGRKEVPEVPPEQAPGNTVH